MSIDTKYSRRTFPIKAIVTYPHKYGSIQNSNKKYRSIGKARLPAIGYTHFIFREQTIPGGKLNEIVVSVGLVVTEPNRYHEFVKALGQRHALRNAKLALGVSGYESIVRIKPLIRSTKFVPVKPDACLCSLIPEQERTISFLNGKNIKQIRVKLNYNGRFRNLYGKTMEGNGVKYYFDVCIKDQITFLLNKCLTNYLRRRFVNKSKLRNGENEQRHCPVETKL